MNDDSSQRHSEANSPSRLFEVRRVAAFTAAYLGVAALATAVRGNLEFTFYLAVMLVLVGVVYAVDRHVRLSAGVLWGLSLWGLLHMAGGLVGIPEHWPHNAETGPVLYDLWLVPDRIKYDQVVHALGFGVTTVVCWEGLASAFRRRGVALRPSAGLLTLCAAAGMGFGALNEVIEFAATLLVPETNVGGYLNTGWDLVANLVGASAAAVAIALRQRNS